MAPRLLLLAHAAASIVGVLVLAAGITSHERGWVFFGALLLVSAVISLGTYRYRQRLRAEKPK